MRNGSKPVRLSLTMVVRDCAPTLEPLLKSLEGHVDQIVIVLGGASQDRTAKIAKRYAGIVLDGARFFPEDPSRWDFAGARNLALSRVTGEFFCWFDGDDRVDHPERLAHVMDYMDRERLGRCDLVYEYDFDAHGNPTVMHQRERVMRTVLGWRWEDRVHETCHTDQEHVIGFSDAIKVVHLRKSGGASERNLPILLAMLEDNPQPRTLLHVAHAYFSLAEYDAAQRYYELYLERPEDDLNQWNAAMMAARCSFVRQDWMGCHAWAMAALAVTPRFKDAYIFLAHAAWWGEKDADKTLAWLEKAERADYAPLSVFRNPLDYTVNTWDVEYRARAALGDFKGALECVSKACMITPTQAWRETVRFYEEAVRCDTSVIAAMQIADHLVRRADLIRAKQFLEYLLPQTIREDSRITAAKQRVQGFLGGVTDPEQMYDEADNHDITGDLSMLKRVRWYIDRLKARGATKILEVGCHNGDVTRCLAAAGFEMTGIDISPKVIEVAKRLSREHPEIRFEAKMLADVLASGETYDAVMFAEILEHLPPQKAVEMLNMADMIAPCVLGSVPAEFLPYSAGLWEDQPGIRGHVVEFDQRDLEELMLTDPARRIVNCHKVTDNVTFRDAPGFGNRLFEYDHQQPMGLGISFYVGPGWEPWSPRSIDEGGVGGSETAAARLAEELARKGHRVVVYAMEDGVHNGVVYRRYEKFDPRDEREVLIVSRQPWLLKERPNAHQVVLWSHDTGYGDLFTPEIAQHIDRIVVMSEWQRGHWLDAYPWLDGEKLAVAGNAITLYDGLEHWWGCDGEKCPYCEGKGTCGEGENTRVPIRHRHRFAYTSSADRGLDELLGMWPQIRDMWPDAELHVFYGFNYLSEARQRRPELGTYLAEIQRAARQPGVFLRGRIGQQELSEELGKAQFWLYPSMAPGGEDWFETFCINALEAQAYGCIPITREIGALAERIEYPDCFIGEWTTANVLERLRWWDARDPLEHDGMKAYARRYEHTWPSIAGLWEGLLLEHVTKLQAEALA